MNFRFLFWMNKRRVLPFEDILPTECINAVWGSCTLYYSSLTAFAWFLFYLCACLFIFNGKESEMISAFAFPLLLHAFLKIVPFLKCRYNETHQLQQILFRICRYNTFDILIIPSFAHCHAQNTLYIRICISIKKI